MFQASNPENQNQNERKVAGLARGLYPQPGKAEEALDLLNQLPDSIQTGTLLTKSRVLQAIKRYEEAEELLKQIIEPSRWRGKKYRSSQRLCNCQYFQIFAPLRLGILQEASNMERLEQNGLKDCSKNTSPP